MKRLILLSSMLTVLMTTGCVRPVQRPILEEIAPNETAFLTTLEGTHDDQARFASVDYLNESKVAAKRVEIPTRWLQTGRFSHQGEWIPTQRLIRVDRSPVARRWTAEVDSGTTKGRQQLEAESRDSIGVSSGFAITASIQEEDTARFLYRYPRSSLASIIDNQIFNDIQSVYSEVAAKYNVSELRHRKEEINEAIRARVIPLYASHGITISPNLGLIGGLVYDNPRIQDTIDAVFMAQNLEAKAEAERAAQLVENERNVSVTEAEARQRQIRADAEAYEIRVKTEAIASGGDAYIRVRTLEVLAEAVAKWTGAVPQTVAGGTGSLLHLLDKSE